jgi:hypothetical protein
MAVSSDTVVINIMLQGGSAADKTAQQVNVALSELTVKAREAAAALASELAGALKAVSAQLAAFDARILMSINALGSLTQGMRAFQAASAVTSTAGKGATKTTEETAKAQASLGTAVNESGQRIKAATKNTQELEKAHKNLKEGVNESEKATGKSSASFSKFSSMVATFQKAIISMIGVLIVFNLLITIPEKIIEGIVAAFKAGVKAVADFQQEVIALTAIIASSQHYSDNMAENYKKSGKIANAVMAEFIRRGKETVATASELGLVFEKIMVAGGDYVKTHREAVDLTILLANAIATLTTGQERSRQLAEETVSFFTQQNRATALLNKFLFTSSTEMQQFWDKARESGKALEMIREKLAGFVIASQDLGSTLEGIKTTFISIGTQFAVMALSGPLKRTITFLLEVQDLFYKNTEKVQRLAAVVSASIEALFAGVARAFGLSQFKIEDIFSVVEEYMPKVVGWIIEVIITLENLFRIVRAIVPLMWPIFSFIILNLRAVISLVTGLINLISTFLTGAVKFLTPGSGYTGKMFLADLEKDKQALKDVGSAAVDFGRMTGTMLSGIFSLIGAKTDEERQKIKVHIANAINEFKSQLSKKGELTQGIFGVFLGVGEQIDTIIDGIAQLNKIQNAGAAGDAARADALHRIAGALEEVRKGMADAEYLDEKLSARHHLIDVNALLRPINQRMVQTSAIMRDVEHQFSMLELSIGGLGGTTNTKTSLVGFVDNMDRLEEQLKPTIADFDLLHSKLSTVIEDYGEAEAETEKVRAAMDKLEASISQIERTLASMRKAFVTIFKTTFSEIRESITSFIGANLVEGILRKLQMAEKLRTIKGSSVFVGSSIEESMAHADAEEKEIHLLRDRIRYGDIEAKKLNDLRDAYKLYKGMLGETATASVGLTDALAKEEARVTTLGFKIFGGLKSSIKGVIDLLKGNMLPVVMAVGNALGDAFQKMFEGSQSLLTSIRKFLGEILIMLGKWLVVKGTAEIANSLGLFGAVTGSLVAGLTQIAVGMATIAAGVAMGGSGSGASSTASTQPSSANSKSTTEPTPYWVRNQDIAAQQSIQYTLSENTRVIHALNGEVSRLSKQSGDVLVSGAIRKNPSIVVEPLTKAASRSVVVQRKLGGALFDAST